MNLHSKVYRGIVTHERMGTISHAFTYPTTFFAFDLSELSKISKKISYFGYNETAALSIHDKHYLNGTGTSIEKQLDDLVPCNEVNRTITVTSPRYFGYAFNPVNFHLRMKDDDLLAVVAEVNNTFGDRHVYALDSLKKEKPNIWTAIRPKNFHVSPFNNMDGEYHFTFRVEADEIYLGVDLHRDNQCILKTWIQGSAKELTAQTVGQYAFLHPLDTALNSMPRILWQAAQLYYKKKLPVFKRPNPNSKDTLIDRDQAKKDQLVI